MAGSVSGLTVFGPLPGPIALSLLDGNYNAIAAPINTLNTFSNYYIDSGAVNALVITISAPQVFALSDGLAIDVQVSNTTTSTTPTINVGGTGAKTIVCADGTALPARALIAGGRYRLQYDGANFRALAIAGTSGAGIFGSLTVGTPSAGTALTINALNNTAAVSITDGVGTFQIQTNAAHAFFVGSSNAVPLNFITNNITVGSVSTAGGWVIPTPTAASFALVVNGLSNSFTSNFVAGSTASQSFGLNVDAGTNPTDIAFRVRDVTGTNSYFRVRGDGALFGFGPVALAAVDMTPDTGTFTITGTGFVANPTGTATWVRNGKQVTINLPGLSGTSNATTFNLTGIPAAIQPATLTQLSPLLGVVDNTVAAWTGQVQVNPATGTWAVFLAGANVWTAGGTKRLSNAGSGSAISFSYQLT